VFDIVAVFPDFVTCNGEKILRRYGEAYCREVVPVYGGCVIEMHYDGFNKIPNRCNFAA